MIILGVSLKQNFNFKTQMLAGNSLNSFLDLKSEETTTLVIMVKYVLVGSMRHLCALCAPDEGLIFFLFFHKWILDLGFFENGVIATTPEKRNQTFCTARYLKKE